jgi:hypothetical protein
MPKGHTMTKYTKEDVLCVVNAMRQSTDKHGTALLTGAGCSITAGIPSASKLVEECHSAYPDRFKDKKPTDYGECMGMLVISEREAIIGPYLEKQKLNWAHIAIAALIEKKWINRVLTFNFDSAMARSCGLLGLYPATYDFGIGVTSNTDYLATPSIIHLHGQGFGPVQINADNETKKHAKGLRPLLKDTFEKFPLVVLGYSGESDKVFDELKKAYKNNKRIYWLGFEEEPKPHVRAFMAQHPNKIDYFGGADADEFMIAVAQEAGCFPPKVFADPAAHLLDEMRDVVEFPLAKDDTDDVLKKSRSLLKEHGDKLKLPAVETAVILGDSAKIIAEEQKSKTSKSEMRSPVMIKRAAWAHFKRGTELLEKAVQTKAIDDYEASFPYLERAVELSPKFPRHSPYGALHYLSLQDSRAMQVCLSKPSSNTRRC